MSPKEAQCHGGASTLGKALSRSEGVVLFLVAPGQCTPDLWGTLRWSLHYSLRTRRVLQRVTTKAIPDFEDDFFFFGEGSS